MTKNYTAEIYRHEGENFRSISLSVNEDGSIKMTAQDVGKVVEDVWGDSDYEFFLDVPATALRKLVFALLSERYAGRARAVDEFRTFCLRDGIEHEWSSYS